MYVQRRLRSTAQISLVIRPVWSVFAVRMKKPWVLSSHPIERTAKTLIRLVGYPGWSEPSLGRQAILLVLSCCGSNATWKFLSYWQARCILNVGRAKRIWYLSPMRAAKVQASLRIRAVSPEPSLLAHTSSESRGAFRQKARSLAPLNGWACAVEICHDGMLEDTNSLDGAHVIWHFITAMN